MIGGTLNLSIATVAEQGFKTPYGVSPYMNVGIDDIAFQPGRLKLDLKTVFAPAVDQPPKKFTSGLGLSEIALPDTDEDIVTLGADAALELMNKNDLTPSDIGRIDVATESSFDRSKPASTYIAGCLEQRFDESFRNVDKGERKFACIAGTQAVNDALNWVAAGVRTGKALVIATDEAFYERGDPGEATQGAGAVAMLIDENPRLMSISRIHGYGSRDETDFLKPNQQYPSVDGKRSVQVYLARMREAITHFEEQSGPLHPAEYALAPFHTPFPKMVRKAAALGFRHSIRGTDIEATIADRIGDRPQQADFDADDAYVDAIQAWTEDLRETDEYTSWYNDVVAPTLSLSAHVGNWYTASVHLARVSGLWNALNEGRDLAGENVFVASYGSGSQAEVHQEVVQEQWKERVREFDVVEKLEARTNITDFETYRDLHRAHDETTETDMSPISEATGFVHDGTGSMGERTYRFIG